MEAKNYCFQFDYFINFSNGWQFKEIFKKNLENLHLLLILQKIDHHPSGH